MINSNLYARTSGMLKILMVISLMGIPAGNAKAQPLKNKINSDTFGVAIEGYDTVAYFTKGRAMKGKSEFSYNWNDAQWHFASASHRDLFAAAPENYAPQYGGY